MKEMKYPEKKDGLIFLTQGDIIIFFFKIVLFKISINLKYDFYHTEVLMDVGDVNWSERKRIFLRIRSERLSNVTKSFDSATCHATSTPFSTGTRPSGHLCS